MGIEIWGNIEDELVAAAGLVKPTDSLSGGAQAGSVEAAEGSSVGELVGSVEAAEDTAEGAVAGSVYVGEGAEAHKLASQQESQQMVRDNASAMVSTKHGGSARIDLQAMVPHSQSSTSH
uniref:Uncharacterized protein n=1 Tax=Oryza punctata TaxID=4537 RepID=A0A0E0ME48_ORYPU